MKKSYLMLVASVALFAACSETEKIQENLQDYEPAAIGFTSYAEKATRGDVNDANNLEFYHNTFAVYGSKKNADNTIQYAFGGKPDAAGVQDGVTCTYQTTPDAVLGDWKYDFPRFWDKQAVYNFIAYAPAIAGNPIRYNYNAANAEVGASGNDFSFSNGSFILTGTNLQENAGTAEINKGFTGLSGADMDIMTSNDLVSTDKAVNIDGATRHSGDPVNLAFKHILSKLVVTVNKASSLYEYEVTIKGIQITGLKDKATAYSEKTYTLGDPTATPAVLPHSGWTTSDTNNDNDYAIEYTGNPQLLNEGSFDGNQVWTAGLPFYFIESLVLPQALAGQSNIKLAIQYNIKKGSYDDNRADEIDLTQIAQFGRFMDRHKYILNIIVGPEAITFDASATGWADGGSFEVNAY